MAYGYNWSGMYVGAHGGGGWSDKCFTFNGAGDGCHDGDGWLAGGQVGYNVQTGQFVFGLEFSGSWADITGSNASVSAPADSYHTDVSSIFMLTGRVGMTFDRMLLYVTGGGAWVRDKFEYASGGPIITDTVKQNRTGWTVGAGIEFGLTPNWSLAAQYNFIDLGDKNVTYPVTGFTASADQELHLATVRLNYRFGGSPVVARY